MTAYLASVQEKLKAADRDRAVAVARAAEERKQRRLQVGLAASVVALMALGGGGYIWNQGQKAGRIARTARAVEARPGRCVAAARRGTCHATG